MVPSNKFHTSIMLSHALHSDDVLYLVPTTCHDLPHILSLLNSPHGCLISFP